MAMNGEVLPRQEAILGHCASGAMTPSIPVPSCVHLTVDQVLEWGKEKGSNSLCVEALSHGGSWTLDII